MANPSDDPLGATPLLPKPKGPRADAAEQAFERTVTGRRHYPVAESKVGERPAPDEEDTLVRPNPIMERPPAGAPAVRPSVQESAPAMRASSDLLEQTADAAMLQTSPDGAVSFDISISDDVFNDLACRIGVANGEIVATFFAADPNTARLLEAEAGRLRVQLEKKGMRVSRVDVVLGSSF